MGTHEEFWKNPLVIWIQTFRREQSLKSLPELTDGVFLSQVMEEIDSAIFGPLCAHSELDPKDLNIKVQNLAEVMRNVRRFYQDHLHQLIVMKVPDLLAVVKDTSSDYGLNELKKILLLILGCAVQCERKEYFIEKIKDLDLEVQRGLVTYIQEITENTENILNYRAGDVAELPQEQLFELSETMFYQITKLIDERDEYVEATLDLNLEKQETRAPDNVELNLRTPPLSPSGSVKSSILQANKQRLRDIQNELEERNITIAELKEEISALKTTVENTKQENKSLQTEARWAKTYRDEIDVLKSQLDRMNKVEGENAKFRDKFRELDFYKMRYEELKEQHELLYETKMVLEEQVASSGMKVERVDHLGEENRKLLSQIRALTNERDADQLRIQELLDENVKLNMEKQSSHNEIAVLNAELEHFQTQSSQGLAVPLAVEYNATTSTEMLKLDKENKRLLKLIDTLKESSKSKELENISLTSSVNEKKMTVNKLAKELSRERDKVSKLSDVLRTKDYEMPDEILTRNNVLDALNDPVKGLIETELLGQLRVDDKMRTENDGIPNKNAEQKILKLQQHITKKEEQVESLETKVKEVETYSTKVDQQLAQREKDIASLERRFESAVTENKSLSQSVDLKDDKISALEERIGHLMDSASQDTRKVNKTLEQKLKQIQDLTAKYDEVREQLSDLEGLKVSVKQKEEKINVLVKIKEELEKKLHNVELQLEKAKSSCTQLEHGIKLKDERIGSLETSLSEIDSSNARQQNDRIAYLTKTLSMREQEFNELEGRTEEALALNAKLKNSNRQKDNKIQVMEDRISELEGAEKNISDDKVQQMTQKLRKKEEEITQLEERIEENETQLNKLQRALANKDDKILQLEKSFHQLEETAGQAKKHSTLLEEKSKKLYDLEARIEELTTENKKLGAKVKQKEERYNSLEKNLYELESAASDKNSLSKMLKTKESKIQTMQKALDYKDELLVEKETLIDESQGRSKKLLHALKLREEKLHSLETKIEQLEELESVSTKLGNLLRQREEKIKELEESLDQFNDVNRLNLRLKESTKHKDEKIQSLEERLEDLEEAVKINERLNQQVHQKDEKVSTLQLRIRGLEDSLHKTEQLKDSITKNAEDQIQELNRKVDELMDVKVKRQQSIRRREEKIMSLESRLEEVASDKQRKMSKIQELQSRLEGTMTKYRKLDLSNEEKDEKIHELEARLSELLATYGEHRKLVQQFKLKEEAIIRLEARQEEAENTNKRLTSNVSEYESNISSLKQRLEETLALNNRLDQSVKKQEEKTKQLENQLRDYEERVETCAREKENADRTITKNRKKFENLQNTLSVKEKDLADMEKRFAELKVMEENEKNKAAELIKKKQSLIEDLELRVKSMDVKSKTEVLNETKDQVSALGKRIDDLTSENRRMKLAVQERDGVISDLEKRIDELQLSASDSDKLNKIVKEKNSQISILRGNVEQYQKEVVELETKCESLRSDTSRSQASLRQKDDRIQSLKVQLEENLSKVNRLSNEVSTREEKIKFLEESFTEASAREMDLKEELNQMEAELDSLRQKLGTHVTEKIQFTKRARTELYISRAATVNQHVLTVADLKSGAGSEGEKEKGFSREDYELLEKERSRLLAQNEYISGLNASLQNKNETLRSELETVKNDYAVVLEERDEAREQYKDIDMSATKIAHRCEVLVKLNATLEEENKTLMDQVNKLLEQNQNLLFKSLESRDQFLEEERAFSDRVYFLEREKERLCDQVDAANKALEGTNIKKKNLLWRGANKVLKKAGLKKRKDEKPNVSLIRVTRSPEGESRSEASDSSFSPNQAAWRRDDPTRSLSPEFAPIRTALSRSRLDLHEIGTDLNANNSPSSGSEQSGPSSRMRPKSEFYPHPEFDSPLKRPKSMEMLDALRVENESFLNDVESRHRGQHPDRHGIDMHPRRPEIVRKASTNSNSSVRSTVSIQSSTSRQSGASSGQYPGPMNSSQGGRHYSSPVTTRELPGPDSFTTQDHTIQKVRITEMVIPKSSRTHVPGDVATPTNPDLDTTNRNLRSVGVQGTDINSQQMVNLDHSMYTSPEQRNEAERFSMEERSYSVPVSIESRSKEYKQNSFVDQKPHIESPKSSRSSIFYVPLEESKLGGSTSGRGESQDRLRIRRDDGGRASFSGERQLQRDVPTQRSVRISVGQVDDRTARQLVIPQDTRRRTVGSFESSTQDQNATEFSRDHRSSFRGTLPPPPPPPPKEIKSDDQPSAQDQTGQNVEKKPDLWYEYGCV